MAETSSLPRSTKVSSPDFLATVGFTNFPLLSRVVSIDISNGLLRSSFLASRRSVAYIASARKGALLISPSSGNSIPVFFDAASSSFCACSAALSSGLTAGDGFASVVLPGVLLFELSPAISTGGVGPGDGETDGEGLGSGSGEKCAGLNGLVTGSCSGSGGMPCWSIAQYPSG